MAIKIASNLSRNRYGVLHFRMAIPPDLRNHFEAKEIYRSLRTASIKNAVHQAQTLSLALKRAFAAIRQQSMPNDKKSPTAPLGDAQPLSVGLQMDFHPTGGRWRFLTEPHDTPEVIQAELATIATMAAHQVPAPAITAPPPLSQLMSSYVEAWLDSVPVEHRQNDKTIASYRAAVQTFIKIVGDKTLREFSFADQNRFDDVIVRLPANSTKLAVSKELSIDEMLLLGLPPISIVNAKNIARRPTNFLKWACKREGFKCEFELCDDVIITRKEGWKETPGIYR